MQEARFTQNLQKSDFRFSRSDRSGQLEDLRMIIFTDEGPVYLSVPGTRKNDHVWAKKRSKVEPIQNSKFAPKLMVWGTMSASGVSEQHVLPPNQTERSK